MPHRIIPLIGLVGLALCIAAVERAAVEQPEHARARTSQPAEPAEKDFPLAGPEVRDRTAQSLVRRDIQDRMEVLDVRPEQAAIDAIPMDPARREQARAVIEERAAAIRRHLVKHIDLVRDATDALRAGDPATAQRVGRDLFDRFDPAHERDPLAKPLAALLTPEEGAQLRRLIDEYWTAWLDAESKAAPGVAREEMLNRLISRQFESEVREAYEATLRPFQQKIEAIYAATDPTPEQRAAIRAAMIEYIRDGQLKPTDAQREKLVRTIYGSLDEERRIKLVGAALKVL